MASPRDPNSPSENYDDSTGRDDASRSKPEPPIEYMQDDANDQPADSTPSSAPKSAPPPPPPMSDQSVSIHATSTPMPISDPMEHLAASVDDQPNQLAPPQPTASSGADDDEDAGGADDNSADVGGPDVGGPDVGGADVGGADVGGATDNSGGASKTPAKSKTKTKPSSTVAKFGLRIPNGTKGKAYKADLPIQIADPATSLVGAGLEFSGLRELGVEYEVFENRVHFSGTPNRDGEHSIHVRFRHPTSGPREYSISFLVNPDPRSLWKNLEPDKDSIYWKDNTDSDRKDGIATMLAASQRGRSHAHAGTFRDDDYSLEFVDDWCVLAVADGAGSAKYSRRGAQLACDVVVERTTQHLRGSLAGDFPDLLAQYARKDGDSEEARRQIGQRLYSSLGDAAMAAYRAVQQESDACEGSQLKDFSTTLLFAICRKFDFGWFVGTFGIGDGGIGVYRTDDDIIILNRPDGGDFAGQTRFLTMSDIWKSPHEIAQRLGFCIVDNFTAVCLMTDGVSDPKFQTDNNFFDTKVWHEFWDDLNSEVRLERENTVAHAELLDWLDFWSKGNHDDRTIAILLP
jgi:hypothetical protein